MPENKLYYGDNLDVLRRYVKDESVDLVYLDPPFNSRQGYNVLFAEKDGTRSASQIMAFEDTWEWNQESARAYEQVVESGGRVAQVMIAFHTFLGGSDMMAYLAMMAPRLIELGRVLKETGSIYLHCDPTASHYLKMLMDAVFSPWCFRSEIVWKRSSAHSDTKQGRKQHGRIHDIILFYTKGEEWTWNPLYTEHVEGSGTALFQRVCELDLEGIVAKQKSAPYITERENSSWFKILNRKYSQKDGREELFERERHSEPVAGWHLCVLACAELEQVNLWKK